MKDIITNLDGIIEKLRNDWDYTIVISGRRRKGKSTLAYHIAEYVSQKLESKIWLCYDYDGEKGLREAMFNSKQFDVIFADETISFLSKNDWNHPHAREFIELFDRSAYKNLLYLFVIPSFSSLMKGFRTLVLDEAHVYEGSFGSHVRLVLERLKALLGQGVQFVASSATIGNPAELGELLFYVLSRVVVSPPARVKLYASLRIFWI